MYYEGIFTEIFNQNIGCFRFIFQTERHIIYIRAESTARGGPNAAMQHRSAAARVYFFLYIYSDGGHPIWILFKVALSLK